MTEQMTSEEQRAYCVAVLDRADAVIAAATPAPWEIREWTESEGDGVTEWNEWKVRALCHGEEGTDDEVIEYMEPSGEPPSDYAAIALMRNIIAPLLEHVKASLPSETAAHDLDLIVKNPTWITNASSIYSAALQRCTTTARAIEAHLEAL